jgi:hypothetical protein
MLGVVGRTFWRKYYRPECLARHHIFYFHFLLWLDFLVLFLVSSFCGKTQITLPLGFCHLFAFPFYLPLCLSSRFATYYLPFILQFFDSIRKILIFSAKALAHLLRPFLRPPLECRQ